MYKVTNPATGTVVEEFPTATDDSIRDAIGRAHAAYLAWRERPVAERAKVVGRAGELFLENREELAQIMTLEMGKRIEESRDEFDIVSKIFAFYADKAQSLLADEKLDIVDGQALIQKAPLGVLIGIMPWNYPYYQVARFAAPNLVLGNTILLKHSSICPRSAQAIEAVMHEAGVPTDAYINVYASSEQIAWMLADDRVQGVSLTGSERAGREVAALAGRNLKKVVLELGGSDPMIILDTEDIGDTVESATDSRMDNCGQACTSPKRMIVMADLYDEFVDRLSATWESYEAGDPADPSTNLAPLSSARAADRLLGQIETAVAQGATLRVGGKRTGGAGAFVQPTVLTDVTPKMDAYSEELFGPVAVIYRADSEDDAIRLANDTRYGLGAGVFSDDPARARRVAKRIDAGMVFINKSGGSWADLPFGGIKRSGIGRELGALGIEEFMNKKIIRL